MKFSRFKEMPRESASKGHVLVFNLLKEMFPYHEFYQEYHYSKILEKAYKQDNIEKAVQNSYYLKKGNSLFADMYDATFKFIVEVQGEQHYYPVIWSKADTLETVMSRFNRQKAIDALKVQIANEARVKLFAIPYKDLKKINSDYIWDLLKEVD